MNETIGIVSNLIQNFGVPVGVMTFLLTVMNKTLAENTCKIEELKTEILKQNSDMILEWSRFREKVDDKVDLAINKMLK